jgi:FkbM family methyltransferase
MKIYRLLKKIPKVKRFITYHNPNLAELIRSLGLLNKQNPIVIDIGANTGQTIDEILTINPTAEIYSFEPTPNLIFGLKNKYNGKSNIRIIDFALANKQAELDFYTSEFSPTNSLLEPDIKLYSEFDSILSKALANSQKVKVKVDTFDNWYSSNGNSAKIDLMKIDTQGTEYEVLKGSLANLKTNIKAVSLEFQYLPFYKNSLPFYETMKLLYENGFILYSFFEKKQKANMQLLENNGLFINSSLI